MPQGKRWTQAQMLEVGTRFVSETGRVPVWEDCELTKWLPARVTITRSFGSWQAYWQALIEAGAQPRYSLGTRPSVPMERDDIQNEFEPGDTEWMGGVVHVRHLIRRAMRFAEGWVVPCRASRDTDHLVAIRHHGGQ